MREIIGLDRDQFAQTVMIAQGDFLRILNASSKDRKALFQKLFHTGLYAQLQERLRQEVGKLQDEAARYAAAIAAARGQIVWSEDAAPAAVSYTHLDVYKRQAQSVRACPAASRAACNACCACRCCVKYLSSTACRSWAAAISRSAGAAFSGQTICPRAAAMAAAYPAASSCSFPTSCSSR